MSATEVDVAIAATLARLAHVRGEGADMQRDMELVRDIFREVIARKDLKLREVRLDGYDPATVGRHVEMLYNAGYIDGVSQQAIKQAYANVEVKDLSWEGHEFACALLADESVWQKVKAALGPEKLASLPLKMIQSVATDALEAWVRGQLGL